MDIREKTWEDASVDTKLDLIYDVLRAINEHNKCQCRQCAERVVKCEAEIEERRKEYLARIERLEHRSLWHGLASFTGGIVGGAVAIIGKSWLVK